VPGVAQRAVGASREESHALVTQLRPEDVVALVPISRGDLTVHSERVVHGSGPNRSPGWRRAYVLVRPVLPRRSI